MQTSQPPRAPLPLTSSPPPGWRPHADRVIDLILAAGQRREALASALTPAPVTSAPVTSAPVTPAPVTPAPERSHPPPRDALSVLIHTFALSPLEADLLRLTVAVELDPDIGDAIQQLRGEPRTRRPTVGLALELLTPPPADRLALLACLHELAPLRQHRLVQLYRPWHLTNPLFLEQELVAPSELLFQVGGETEAPLHAFLEGVAFRRPRPPAISAASGSPAPAASVAPGTSSEPFAPPLPAPFSALHLPEHTRLQLSQLLSFQTSAAFSRLLLQLVGPSGTGRRTLAHALASRLHQDGLEIDLRRLGPGQAGVERLTLALREALRLQCVPIFLHGELLTDALLSGEVPPTPASEDGASSGSSKPPPPALTLRWPTRILNLLDLFPGPVMVVTEEPLLSLTVPPLEPGVKRAPRLSFALTTEMPERSDVLLSLWRQALAGQQQSLPDEQLRTLLGRFLLSPGQIFASVEAAYNRAAGRDPLSPVVQLADLALAAQEQQSRRLESMSRRTRPTLSWDELVLPRPLKQQLLMFEGMLRHREKVYEDWGMARKMATGRGIKALFSGASGTGKTMAASVLASRLGLDLFRVNLAALVSKYVGETEKNIDRIFREARASRSILLFDEADALFGKRAAVTRSADRYANMSTNYLLQRFEEFDGVVILTSNFPTAIDDAFSRRLHFLVAFPTPDETSRQELWRSRIPAEMPLAEDVDLARLARFELSGGNITNAVTTAAFLAAGRDGVTAEGERVEPRVGMLDFMRAIRWEQQKLGRITQASDFVGYFERLDEQGG